MTGNISKEKRDSLISKLDELKQFVKDKDKDNDGKFSAYLSEMQAELKSKKYGLVFEEHREEIDNILDNNEPILIEQKKYLIPSGKINFLIEGDNIASLKLLEKTHKGLIDIIYIDPPYNTGNNDFKYNDVFVDSVDTFTHSKWLSFMEKRLSLANIILKQGGVIFISIDEHEYANLKLLCNNVFGEKNFVGDIIRKTKSVTGDKNTGFNLQHEYLLIYSKGAIAKKLYGGVRELSEYKNPDNDHNGAWVSADPSAKSGGKSTSFEIKNPYTNKIDLPPKGRYWAFSQSTLEEYIKSGKIVFKKEHRYNERGFIFKRYAKDLENTGNVLNSLDCIENVYMNQAGTKESIELDFQDQFKYPKPVSFIKKILLHSTTKESIVVDFFAGSGTTAQAVMELNKKDEGNRKFILCTNNENGICENVTFERIKKVIEREDYKEGLKYFKVDFVDKKDKVYYEYAGELLAHIKELVELENALDFSNNKTVAIVLDDNQMDNLINKLDFTCPLKKIYVGHDIMLSIEQQQKLVSHGIEFITIPEYYYRENI